MDVAAALVKLNGHLPLAERQRALPPGLRRLHVRVLRWFLDNGEAPTALDLGLDIETFERNILHLAHLDLIVTSAGAIIGVYPFTTQHTPHRVTMGLVDVRATCALDALAIAPMFDVASRIRSACTMTNETIQIDMHGQSIQSHHPADLYVGISFQDTWGCAATSLCTDIVYLRDRATALDWQGEAGDAAPVFTLNDAVELASRFFGRLLHEVD